MVNKFKCWKKIANYGQKDKEGRKSLTETWKKEGKRDYSLVDVRDYGSKDVKGFVNLSIYPEKGKSKQISFPSRRRAVDVANKYMKKHDKC